MSALSYLKAEKPGRKRCLLLLLCPVWAQAAPQGAQVVSGQAVVKQSKQAGQNQTTITQSSQTATLNWQQFNVAPGESVRFVQPAASSVTVNRISDPNGSRILGQISANGQVWLINPSGVYVGPGAQVNVGGLLASTLNLSAQTNPYQLQGPATAGGNTATVTNDGHVQTAEGGYAVLMGGHVGNAGNISAPGGRIVLSGDKQNGSVTLSGKLDTSSTVSLTPGFIETSAARVRIADTASVLTRGADGSSGEWLIDPTNFTISSGSGASTTSSIGASTLSTSLASSNVSIATDNTSGSDSGNIYVNSSVSWSAATQLTLSAYKDIYINAPVTASNSSGKLKLMYGQGSTSGTISGVASDYHVNAPVTLAAGANFFTQLGSDTANLKTYQVITSLGSKGSTTGTDLQGMNGSLTTNYALGADIDASGTTSWSTNANYKGFTKIGNNTTTADYYSGTFAGLGHVISDLYLYRPLVGVSGLFAVLSSDAVLRDTGMVNMAITTNSSGGLVGRNYGTIKNSFTTGSITSQAGFVGGLAGDNGDTGSITNSYSTATVTATTDIPAGGLVGRNYGSVVNSYAAGSVSGSSGYTGGLMGELKAIGSVTDSAWNTSTSGQSSGYGSVSAGSSSGVTGLSTAAMKLSSNYSSWNFTSPWIIYSGYTAPLLRAFMTPLTVSAYAYGTQVYDGTTNTTAASYTDPGSLSKTFSGSISFALDGADVGTHSVVASGFYSDQLGYQISYSFSTNSVTVTSSASSATTSVPSITQSTATSTASTASTASTSTASTSTASTSAASTASTTSATTSTNSTSTTTNGISPASASTNNSTSSSTTGSTVASSSSTASNPSTSETSSSTGSTSSVATTSPSSTTSSPTTSSPTTSSSSTASSSTASSSTASSSTASSSTASSSTTSSSTTSSSTTSSSTNPSSIASSSGLTPVIETNTASAPAADYSSTSPTDSTTDAAPVENNNLAVATYTGVDAGMAEDETPTREVTASETTSAVPDTDPASQTSASTDSGLEISISVTYLDPVNAQKQSHLTLPSINDKLPLRTYPGNPQLATDQPTPGGLPHAWNAEFSVNNFGSSYTGEVQTGWHQQHSQVFNPGDQLELNLLASSGDMQFGRWAYEWPVGPSGWRLGAANAYLAYKLGGSAASLKAYGNARQSSVWADRELWRNEQSQWNWRAQYDSMDLQDIEDTSSTRNDRLLRVWRLNTAVSRHDKLGPGHSWLNMDLYWSDLQFNNTTAQTTDAAAADTQGRSHKIALSAGRLQPLTDQTQLLLNWQAQWAYKNLDTTQKMSFGGAHSVRAYAPGVLSGDAGHFLSAEIKHLLNSSRHSQNRSGDWYASVFIDAGWLTLYQNPYASGDNQARLAGVGAGLSWEGPDHWHASLSFSQPLGSAPSQLSGSSYLHANAWLSVSKGFR